jgi:hypothetical protein
MNNPGVDLNIWKQLNKKWAELDSKGHQVKVEFKLITSPVDSNRTMMIDVIQRIEDEIVVDTVQQKAGEAYEALGLAGLSMERLVQVYKDILKNVYNEAKQYKSELVVTMSPTSSTSGEVQAYLQSHDEPVKQAVLTNYQHYYVLNALREKMMEQLGENWKQVKAVYKQDAVEYYFEY